MRKCIPFFALFAAMLLIGNELLPAEKPIKWFAGSFEEALDQAGSQSTFVMLAFLSDESAPSKDLETETLSDTAVAGALSDVVCYKIDVANAPPVLFDEHSIDRVPTCLFLKPSGREFGRLVGYRSPGRFAALLSMVKEAFTSESSEKVIAEARGDEEATEISEILGRPEKPTAEEAPPTPPRKPGEAELKPAAAPPKKAEEVTVTRTSRAKELYEEALEFLRTGKGEEALKNFFSVQELDPENSEGYYEKAAYQILGIQVHDAVVKFTRLRREVRGDLFPLPDSEIVSDKVRPPFKDASVGDLLRQAEAVSRPFIGKRFVGPEEKRQEAIAQMDRLRSLLFEALAAEFENYLKRFPQTKMKALTLQNLQRLYFKAGDAENGARVSEELLRLGMNDVPSLCRYARNLAILGFRLDRAKELAEKAYEKERESLEVLDTLALIEFKRGNIERAVELQEDAVRLAPGTPVLQKRLDSYRKALEEKGKE